MAEELLTMFGKAYNTVGSANSNLILLTRGDIKVRWGNKFIDLIKNGKVNAEVDLLKKVSDTNAIHTDGVYLINKDGVDEIWVMIDGTLVNLKGEIGDTYVSYKGILEVTIDDKFMALNNIGLYYKTYEDLVNSGILNGVAFVLEIGKFYTVMEGEIKEYTIDTIIPDPLIVDGITINGITETIYANNMLVFGITNSKVFTIEPETFTFHTKVATNGAISSSNYDEHRGYSIYIDSALDESVAVFDKVIIRKSIVYDAEEEITYDDLLKLLKTKSLVKDKKYIIVDFLDIRNVTYYDETNLKNSTVDGFKLKNVYPIVVKAKNNEELEKEGYFLENPNWVIEYDPYYNHIVKYKIATGDEEYGVVGAYVIAYSKGRILKMTDEFGNSANFDFKHTTFSDEHRYLFNIANPRIKELNKLIDINTDASTISSLNAEKAATNIYADATLDVDVTITIETNADGKTVAKFERIRNTDIVNNTIYIAEPELVNSSIVADTKEIVTKDYIIFNDCSTLTPNNNTIKDVLGNFKVLKKFEGNDFKGIVYKNNDVHQINSIFLNNTANIIYFKNEDGEVLFDSNSTYDRNIFGSITNSEFKKGLTANTFKNLTNVIIDKYITLNVFEKDLLDLHIKSGSMSKNTFKGYINTYTNIETYVIDGTLTNNIFYDDLECVTFNDTCVLTNNEFFDIIKYQGGVYTVFKGKIDKCQFGQINGCEFKLDSQLYNVLFYNLDLFLYTDMTLVIIDKIIRNSLFKDDIINVHFYDNIDKVTSEGVIGNNLTSSTFGKVEFSTFYADVMSCIAKDSTISYSEFNLITKLKVNLDAIISNSTFNAEINDCEIEGNINNCSFEKLSAGIKVTGPLNNVNILVDMTPAAARYVEDPDDGETLIENNPFIISVERVPKLAISGRKTCSITTRSYNGSDVRVFIVKTNSDDYTPVGVIVMFSGTISQIPDGWALCDGTKGTPDLRGRFIRMVSAGENPGVQNNSDLETNGAGTRQAYLKKTIKHTHTYKTYTDNVTATTSDLTASYTSAHSLGVDTSGLTIKVDDYTLNYYAVGTTGVVVGRVPLNSEGDAIARYSATATHKHTASLLGSATITGSLPGISVSGSISVPISFTPEQDPDETGFEDAINVEPLAYALVFIMKL